MKTRIYAFVILIAAMAVMTCSCTKDDEDTLPEMPPVEALLMDFSDFTTMPDTNLKSNPTYQNFAHSFITVFGWTWASTSVIAIPAVVYAESFNHTPVYLGDNTWEWSYSKDLLQVTFTARLTTQRISNEEFKAEMYITQEGGFEDFKWFEGTIRYDRTHAVWTLYESPEISAPILEVEWNKDWELDVYDITYTFIKEDDNWYGNYITFGIVDDEAYDAYYTILNSDQLIEIQWNLTTKAGRVKDEAKFGDTGWHCWNELFQDIDCS